LFNESPYLDRVMDSIDLGFNLVMFTDEDLAWEDQIDAVTRVVEKAHGQGVAVEGEMESPPGLAGELAEVPTEVHLDNPSFAQEFAEKTGIDALAVNIGQAHLHGRYQVPLNLERLAELYEAVPVPLVLHGASSVSDADLREAIRRGIRKINVGSVLKRTFFETLRDAGAQAGHSYNPYEVMGSGLSKDVMAGARMALQEKVQDLMVLFGSAGRAD
jgi:fructose-bisphosphate aldolase class II